MKRYFAMACTIFSGLVVANPCMETCHESLDRKMEYCSRYDGSNDGDDQLYARCKAEAEADFIYCMNHC